MKIFSFLKNVEKRSEVIHLILFFLLIVNMLFFTQSDASILLQSLLLVAIIFHYKDNKTVKENLKKSEIQLREDMNIFDRNIIVSESDLDGIITYVNKNFTEISGYSQEELLGKPHSILRDPDTPKEFFSDLWQTIQSGETFHGIIKNIKKDGSPYWIDAAITPIKVNNIIVGYKAIRFDISDKMIARAKYKKEIQKKQKLLQEQSERFEFAINASRDGFWDFDVTSQEFYLSTQWKKRLGFQEDEKVNYLAYVSLIPQKDRLEYHNTMHSIIDENPDNLNFFHFRICYSLVSKVGEKLLIEDVGDAFFEKNTQEITRITGFHRDITELKRQEKMIESQNRIAAMGDMIGNIAHQWRQPIGAINNVLNDLEFDIELEDLTQIDTEKFLQTSKKIKEYTSHLSQTIDDFRNLSSDDKVKSKFLLKDVLEEAHSLVEEAFKKHQIAFLVENIGDCTCEIDGYKRELLQVFINILNNAKDVLVDKAIQNPQVTLGLYRDDANIFVSIHDNAGGVPEAIIEKIFDPYFTTKHESIGTGIGLFMSKKMLTEHFDASLSVENEAGGAKFLVTLPRPKQISKEVIKTSKKIIKKTTAISYDMMKQEAQSSKLV